MEHAAHHAHGEIRFDEASWEERYRTAPALWSGRANPQLVAEAAALTPGRALDAGSGEGGDAVWLAGRGWQVTAVDFSTVALARAAAAAERLGPEVAGRVKWVHADLTGWAPPAGAFDLVSVQYFHLPPQDRDPVFARLAAAVAPGGSLLVVGHRPSELHTGLPEMFFTAGQVAATLDPAAWDVVVCEDRPRTASGPAGHELPIADTVLRARRRA
jgi:SAM-dependent methyltransferase